MKIKNFLQIFLGTTVLCFLTSFSPSALNEKNCSMLHEGTFRYGNTPREIMVIIKGNKYIEYHNHGKYIVKSDIEWLNECEFNMTMKKVTCPDFPCNVGDVTNVKINAITGSEITFTSTVNGKTSEGVMEKVK